MKTFVQWVLALTLAAIAALIVIPSAAVLLQSRTDGLRGVPSPPEPPAAPRLTLPPADNVSAEVWLKVTDQLIKGYDKQTAVYLKQVESYGKRVDAYKVHAEQRAKPPSVATYTAVVKDVLVGLVSTLITALTAGALAVVGAAAMTRYLQYRGGGAVEPFRLRSLW